VTVTTFRKSRAAGVGLTLAIVALTAATAYIHFSLGGLLFTLNGLGYVGLIGLILLAAASPHPLVARFSWFAHFGLAGYAALTIAGYLVMGPYFSLGWIAKGIEVAIIALVALDVLRIYGSPQAYVRTAIASVLGQRTQSAA
jgi:hypothetical protein